MAKNILYYSLDNLGNYWHNEYCFWDKNHAIYVFFRITLLYSLPFWDKLAFIFYFSIQMEVYPLITYNPLSISGGLYK